jgi:hypothetical protein
MIAAWRNLATQRYEINAASTTGLLIAPTNAPVSILRKSAPPRARERCYAALAKGL